MKRSIRWRLLIPLAGLYALGWLLTAVYAYYQASHEVDQLFDQQLVLIGNTLYSLVRHEILEDEQPLLPVDNLPAIAEPRQDIVFQIALGALVINSSEELSQEVDAPPGLARIVANGKTWRVYSVSDDRHGFRVHVLEPVHIRKQLRTGITSTLVTPLLLVIPGLLLLSWLIIGDALRPLRRVSQLVESRSPEDLAPLDDRRVPREIHTLVGAINHLLARLQDALARERRVTADAAHELRTPLAALKIQAEVARRARDDDERENALQQIHNGVDRTAHLIEQLLTLARLEPESKETLETHEMTLCPLISACVAALYDEALAKNIDLGVQHCDCRQAPIRANATAIEILLRNLVGNALRYTPRGGRIDIRTRVDEHTVILEIADNGPGIPAAQRQRVFDRFYRASEHRMTQGSGLGLSIVARIAELHGARIRLSETSPHGGLTLTLRFPRADR